MILSEEQEQFKQSSLKFAIEALKGETEVINDLKMIDITRANMEKKKQRVDVEKLIKDAFAPFLDQLKNAEFNHGDIQAGLQLLSTEITHLEDKIELGFKSNMEETMPVQSVFPMMPKLFLDSSILNGLPMQKANLSPPSSKRSYKSLIVGEAS